MSSRGASPGLIHDVFDFHIIPDILADHLHHLLVDPDPPTWHAFYILPLVSKAFDGTCRSLCKIIFGLVNDEGGRMIDHVLTRAQWQWRQVKLGPHGTHPKETYPYCELMASESLIQVYICCALAWSFFHVDVMSYIEAEYSMGVNGGGNIGRYRRSYRMPDEGMHTVYMPLTCAMKLCDTIRPERLVFTIAPYLADMVPLCSTAPVMLKYAQNLETYIAREHPIDMEMWVEWTQQTLDCIEQTGSLLKDMQDMSRIVKSFKRSSAIPRKVLRITKVLEALQDVADAKWGDSSEEVRERALELFDDAWDSSE